MTGKSSVARQIGWVMRQELSDALRSRRAAVILLLYLAVSALTMNGALSGLLRLENELASVLQLPASPEPGAVTSALWKSERFRRIVSSATGSSSLVSELIGVSPIVLIFAGLAFFYTPLLAILVVSPRISEEISGGAARFALSRTSRGAWSAGKSLGLVALVGVALLMGGAGAWTVARFRMPGADPLELASGILVESVRALAYSIPYLGLALGVSHVTRSPSRATGVALAVLFAVSLLAWVSAKYAGEGWAALWNAARAVTPQAYRVDLWFRAPARFLPAAVSLAALGAVYAAAGFLLFRRRDL